MVNTDDFIKRLEEILDFYSLSASAFADKVSVQRSGLSHLLSGRNKPSLDFVMKIVENFPEVDLYWLLFGEGTFPKSDVPATPPAPPQNHAQDNKVQQNKANDLFSSMDDTDEAGIESTAPETALHNAPPAVPPQAGAANNYAIERIVIFYKNGTFKNYIP